MELHVIWFIIPFILLCGIVYSVLRGYIYGAVLAALSLLAALINLVYYIAGFFLHIKIRNTLALCLFLGVMSALADGGTSLCIQALGQTALRFHVPDRKRIPDPHLEHPCLYFLFPVMPVPDAGVQQRPHYSHYEHNSLYVFHNVPSCLQTAFSFPSCFSVPL